MLVFVRVADHIICILAIVTMIVHFVMVMFLCSGRTVIIVISVIVSIVIVIVDAITSYEYL